MTSYFRGDNLAENVFRANRDSIIKWLKNLTEDYEIWAPARERFEILEEPEKISLEYENTIIPPKEIVFPQTEKLMEFNISNNEVRATLPESRKKVIFGIRPCDARAIRILDIVFRGDYEDPYYTTRKNGTVLVVLTCNEYCEEGFCSATGGSPGDSDSADILMTKLDDESFQIEFLTEKGRELGFDDFEAAEKVEPELPEPEYTKNLENADGWLSYKFVSPEWDKFARKCISCGICTFLCPTCHCFDITDTKNRRIRTWDSCQFSEYTVHTSSHNPRPEKVHRVRNRVLHKFLYFKERNNELMCVGCGRCVRLCPEGIDIREIVESMED